MKWFLDLKIAVKLLVGFVLVAIIAGIIGTIGTLNIRKSIVVSDELYQFNVLPIQYLGDAEIHFQQIRVFIRNALLIQDADAIRKNVDSARETHKKVEEDLAKVDKMVRKPEQRVIYVKLLDDLKACARWEDKVLNLALADKQSDAFAMLRSDGYKAVGDSVNSALEKLKQMKADSAKMDAEEGHQNGNSAVNECIVFTIIGMILAVVLGLFMARIISRPLVELASQAQQVAQGNLRVTVAADSKDEVGQLARSFATMIESLNSIISQVSDTSLKVASSSRQLNDTAEQMATGAEEVAAQVGTVATAGEEMAATSSEIAQNCQYAAEGGKKASDTAQNGAVVVNSTVEVMNRISERVKVTAHTVDQLGARSDQIGEIIGTIEDIADQTNLLALNAAIEAARAGEQGRGFAVVADEVRALAERTTKATREIGEMIKAIQSETRGAVSAMDEGVKEVERGTSEAFKSGQALKEIIEQVNAVTMQISQIATAAEQQTATTSEISTNIQQITQVVQNTSNGAHESANAASQLSDLAENLQRIVNQFKLSV